LGVSDGSWGCMVKVHEVQWLLGVTQARFWKGILAYRSMELISTIFVFMKVKRLISFWYWNGKLFVCKDVCILLCMSGMYGVTWSIWFCHNVYWSSLL
jgi:hypothetical protein